MAGAFYMPNLLPNGSFEQPGTAGRGVAGWKVVPSGAWNVTTSSNASDGRTALQFQTEPVTTPDATAQTGGITNLDLLTVCSGDVYQFNAQVNPYSTLEGATVSLSLVVGLFYPDKTAQSISLPLATGSANVYSPVTTTLTIPASTGGAKFATATVSLEASVETTTAGGVATFLVDEVGLALISPNQPYGRMPGTAPLGTAVRLTNVWAR